MSVIVRVPSLVSSDIDIRSLAKLTGVFVAPRVQKNVGAGCPVAVQGRVMVSPSKTRVSFKALPWVKEGDWAKEKKRGMCEEKEFSRLYIEPG